MALSFPALPDVAWAHLLVLASHLYLAAIMMAFSLLLHQRRIQQSRLCRVSAAVLLAALLLAGQPLIYNFRAAHHQPWGIGLAAIAFMAACTMLVQAADMRQRPPKAGWAAATWALDCMFQHINHGVVAVHKRRRQRTAARAAAPANAASSIAPAAATTKPKQTQAELRPRAHKPPCSRPVIHVEAVASPAPAAAGLASPASERAKLQQAEQRRQLQAKLLREAGWVLLRLMVAYDVGIALLCCSSGCWCAAADTGDDSDSPAGQPAPYYGLLQDLLGPLAGRFAWCWAAGLLLPMQMGIGYAVSRLVVVALGRLEVALDMPPRAFHNVLAATSISDLWGSRWHQFLRFYFQAIAFPIADTCIVAPLQQRLLPLLRHRTPATPAQQQRHNHHQLLLPVSRTLCVFALSGLLHEYLTLAAFGGRLTGSYMAFFMLHGLLVVLEGLAAQLLGMRLGMPHLKPQPPASNASAAMMMTATAVAAAAQDGGAAGGDDDKMLLSSKPEAAAAAVSRWPRVVLRVRWLLCWCYTIAVTVLLSPLFVEPYRQAGYFRHSWHAFGTPVAATALARVGLCGCK